MFSSFGHKVHATDCKNKLTRVGNETDINATKYHYRCQGSTYIIKFPKRYTFQFY